MTNIANRKSNKKRAAKPKASTSKGVGKGLMLMVPPETLQSLKVTAAENDTTVRALVLEALRDSGYAVPADELVDRRKA